MDINDQSKAAVAGTVTSVIFQNTENWYTVCSIEDEEGDEVVAVGTLPYISKGEHILAQGIWTHHSVYGRQFKIEAYEKQLPTSENDILRYLSSGTIKGIGARTARQIVDRFGESTFDVMEHHPEWLADIRGITPKRAREISHQFSEGSGARNVMMFCRDYFGPSVSMKIYKKWGGGAVDIIKNDPYRLCGEFYGIGFGKADEIAKGCGIADDDESRVRSGILYVLSTESVRNGHTCLPVGEVYKKSAELLAVSQSRVREVLVKMITAGLAYVTGSGEEGRIYSAACYNAERYSAAKLKAVNSGCPKIDLADVEELIRQTEYASGITYAPAQREAIRSALTAGVMILTGGPGTGKTTIIKGLLSIFDRLEMKTALAAPTGRAAKRMSESTSHEAGTLHRLLEMEYTGDTTTPVYCRDEKNPLDENVIIVDEASMIDIFLFEALLKAVRPASRLILIGDCDQLPSVGAGQVLGDVISSGCFHTVRLSEIFRQSGGSLIVENAHAINEGRMPDISQKRSDFFFLPRSSDADIAATIADLYKNRLPRSYGADTINKIQVITPSKKGQAGTENLNQLLQSVLNPADPGKSERLIRDVVFREGDRVMQTRNNYSLEWERDGDVGVGIFNGDIGIIEEIDYAESMMTINFDDRITVYDFSNLDELEHAYAVTVHKSQGSEYPYVIIPMYGCAPMLQSRNLLYTAVTRAEKMVILVGRRDILANMVSNEAHQLRHTGLRDMLTAGD